MTGLTGGASDFSEVFVRWDGYPSEDEKNGGVMAEIKCPHCGEVFQVDETEYAQIVRQVRDAEFQRELAAREQLAERERSSAVDAAVARERQDAERRMAQKDGELARLHAELERGQDALKLARAAAEKDLAERLADSRQRISALEAQLEARESAFAAEKSLAVAEATG